MQSISRRPALIGALCLGSFTNSSVQADSLSVAYVRGTISEDGTEGDTDEIHAREGRCCHSASGR